MTRNVFGAEATPNVDQVERLARYVRAAADALAAQDETTLAERTRRVSRSGAGLARFLGA